MAASRGQSYQSLLFPDQFFILGINSKTGAIFLYQRPGPLVLEVTETQLDAQFQLIDEIPENRLEGRIDSQGRLRQAQ
jgi:hypothetical protein